MSHTLYLWREQPGAFRAWLALGLYNLALGLVLILGGAARVASPAYLLIREWGGPSLWGVGFVALGVLMLCAIAVSPLFAGVTLLIGSIAHGWFAAQFVAAAFVEPHAGLTGCATYLLVAFWHASLAVVYRAGPTGPSRTRTTPRPVDATASAVQPLRLDLTKTPTVAVER